MRICYLANIVSVHAKKWVSYFVNKGYDVHVISFEKGTIYGAKVHIIRMPFLSRNRTFGLKMMYLGKIRKLIDKIKPDLIHAFYVTNYGYFASKMDFHPLIVTAEGSDILELKTESRIMRYAKRKIAEGVLKKADLMTTDANHVKARMFELGANQGKIEVVQFGVDVNKFTTNGNHTKIDQVKTKLNIHNRPSVISLRNLYPIYNVETLIKSIPMVIGEHPTCKFIIASTGSEKEKLVSMATSLGIDQPYNLEFVGRIENDELPNYLNAVDVYVSTSLSDAGLSMSTAEAMACGRVVLITDTYENKDWVSDADQFLFKNHDSAELAVKLNRILGWDKDTHQKYGNLNREKVVKDDNYDTCMNKMDSIYWKQYTRS